VFALFAAQSETSSKTMLVAENTSHGSSFRSVNGTMTNSIACSKALGLTFATHPTS
jgi:hypothetical protein